MKTFTIYETVPITQHRTITIEAEDEDDAVAKYLEGKVDYEVDTEDVIEWDNAEIVDVKEEKE
jgi:hypothetical protein